MRNVKRLLLAVALVLISSSAIAGQIPIFGGTVKLSSDQVKDYVLSIQGNITSGGTLVWPAGVAGSWDITNSANAAIQIKYRDQGTPLIIAQGAEQLVYGNGQTLVAQSGSGGGAPSGTAGGDLGGTYPNPTVTSASHITNIGATQGALKYDAYGDSNTAVSIYLPQIFPASYVDYLRLQYNVIPQNEGHGGDLACDGTEQVFRTTDSLNFTLIKTFMEGINEAATKGAGAYEPVFNACEQAAASYFAISPQYKIPASSSTLTGTWVASTSGYAGSPLISSTNGSSETYTVNVGSNGEAIGWYRNADGDGGTFSVTVDGAVFNSYTTATTPTIATQNGGTHGASPIIMTGLTPGSRQIKVTVTSSTNASNNVEVVGFSPIPTTSVQPIYAVIGGVIEQAGNTGAANTLAYNNDAAANAASLAALGLPVSFANVRNYVNNSTDMYNTLHPNAAGMLHYAQAFEAVLPNFAVSVLPQIQITSSPNDTFPYGSTGVGMGALTGQAASAAYKNTCVGYFCMGQALTSSGIQNDGSGFEAGYFLTGGHDNSLHGFQAGLNLVSGSMNDISGSQAAGGAINAGIVNETFHGFKAGYSAASGSMTCEGSQSCMNASSGGSIAALGANSCLATTSGASNLCLGTGVGQTNPTTGSNNALIGVSSAVSTPASGTSNYLNLQNTLIADWAKGIVGWKGSAVGAPTSCGTGASVTAGGNDIVGEVTEGSSASGCTIPFANPHTNAPVCQVISESGLGLSYVVSTTGIVITNVGALSSTKITWQCFFASTTNNPTP